MKMKKLFTLAALLTSSLASAIDLADLENKYYVGLNFGGQYSSGLSLRPNLLIGYHYQKSSKLELEVNANFHSLTNVTLGLLGNYRYYPDLNLDPVTLYVSGGLGTGFTIGGGTSSGGLALNPTQGDDNGAKDGLTDLSEGNKSAEDGFIDLNEGNKSVEDGSEISKNEPSTEVEAAQVMYANQASEQSLASKILGHIAYKLKIGVDYEFTPQIIGAVGLNLGGFLYDLSQLQIGTGIEVGIRYNF